MLFRSGNLGETLYKNIFGGGSRLTVLTEEKILEASNRLRLSEGSGINMKIENPEEIDPDEATLEMAESYFSTLPEEVRAAGGLSTLSPGAKVPTANPGSLAFAIQSVALAPTYRAAREAWNTNEAWWQAPGFIRAAALRLVALSPTKKALDGLVKRFVSLHTDESFKAAVVARREKNNWQNGST